MVIPEKKIIFNHALRITFWVRYYFDRNKKKREKITSANRLRDDNFCVKSSTPSFADQKSVQKSISSRNREIFEFK